MRRLGKVLKISQWHTPASNYPRHAHGIAAICDSIYKRGFYDFCGRCLPGTSDAYLYYQATRPLKITNLTIDGKVWMIDDPLHWVEIQNIAAECSGRILVAGLGLGLIVHALDANPLVSDVTVVEINQAVIDLVWPLVPQAKAKVVCGDFWDYLAEPAPDWVFYDLAVGIGGMALYAQSLRDMLNLGRLYPAARLRVLGVVNDTVEAQARAVLAALASSQIKEFYEQQLAASQTPSSPA